ncbi:hypothetical protein LCGC14_1734840 [marine sediment metagenome]|uniref:Uncharacterized protein n=1 Tax=marine sediment metagenome TaxID=412755 RepID=A0A0F9HW23_9ZZZZ
MSDCRETDVSPQKDCDHITLENEFREAIKRLFRGRGFDATADGVVEKVAIKFAAQVNGLVPKRGGTT